MNTGVKTGVHADKAEIVAEYGETAQQKFNALGTAFYTKMSEYYMDPQTIADGILELVNYEKGSRPLRFPLDAIAEGTDAEFIRMRAEVKEKWIAKYQN